jgi:hypothetical protein
MLSVFTVKNIRVWDPNTIRRNTQESLSKAKVLLLQKSVLPIRSVASKHTHWEAHLCFTPDTTFPLMRIGHIWVHNSSQLAIVLGSGGINIYNERK